MNHLIISLLIFISNVPATKSVVLKYVYDKGGFNALVTTCLNCMS